MAKQVIRCRNCGEVIVPDNVMDGLNAFEHDHGYPCDPSVRYTGNYTEWDKALIAMPETKQDIINQFYNESTTETNESGTT